LIIADKKSADQIQKMLSALSIDAACERNSAKIKNAVKSKKTGLVILDSDLAILKRKNIRAGIIKGLKKSKKDFIVLSSRKTPAAVLEVKENGALDYIVKPYNQREFIGHFNAIMFKKTRITCIGGGTGLFHILMGLKKLPKVFLTSIVSVTDDGGSSGRLRTSFGVLPPGDVRRSLIALSNAPEVMNELVRYRFSKGEGVKGHNLGNLFLTALAEITGSTSEAVRTLGDIMFIQGVVLPVTDEDVSLNARFEDGTVIKSETKIDLADGRDPNLHIKEIWHEPEAICNMSALSAIINSDIVVIGPGDLYTSIITNLLVKNLKEAIAQTRAERIYICNLMTKPGETARFTAPDHIKEIIRYLGGDYLDSVIVSNTKLSRSAVDLYWKKQQSPVEARKADEIRSITKAKIIFADVGDQHELVRHDSDKVKEVIRRLI